MYSIIIDYKINENSIYVNELILQENNIKSEKITLHFGTFEKELAIKTDHQIEPTTIVLPHKLNEELCIPDLSYESYFEGNHLFLGPVIGYLTDINCRRQESAILYFSKYNEIKGLIFIFQEKSINRKNKTILGHYYNNETKTFVEGIFPYPGSIYVRRYIKKGTFEHLKKHIGNKIFNYPYNIDKLSLWKMLSKDSELMDHLPETAVYSDNKKLLEILKLYNEVYLKPFNKSRGRGILLLQRYKQWYILKDEFCRSIPLKTQEDLEKILEKKLSKNTTYLIQRAIPLRYGRNKADFRVYIQKNHTKHWMFSGMETKIAKVGSIISNSKNRSKIIPGKIALKEIFSLDDDQVKLLINEVARLCIKALKTIEKNDYFIGDTAIDLIIDENLKIWILEVQLNYAALKKANRTEDEQQVLPNILSTPFEYAKALQNFDKKE